MELAIKLFLCSWFITHFEPIKEHLDNLYQKYWGTWIGVGFDILTCFKCLSFWLIFLFTLDPFYAMAGSFLANIYTDVVEK